MDAWDELDHQQQAQTSGDDRLRQLKWLAKKLIEADMRVADAEAELSKLKADRERLRRFQIPELMMELGLDSFSADNHSLTMTTSVTATLPKDPDKRAAAIDWLVNNGHGGIIKRTLTVELPKGDAVAEAVLIDAVHEAAPDLHPDVAYNAHHSTYAALMRGLVKKGALLPTDMLGVSIENLAKVVEK